MSETVFFWGGGDQVLASQIKTKEEIFCVTVAAVQGPKQFLFFFFGGGDQVFASQIKTKREIWWVIIPAP